MERFGGWRSSSWFWRGGNDRGGNRWGGGRWGNRGGWRDERREFFLVTCDDCGDECEVPFKPTGDKPVYCSHCFRNHDDRGSRDDRGWRDNWRWRRDDRWWRDDRGGRDSFEKRMYKWICDDCGDECEVPFKPTWEKPLYCSDCFSKEDRQKWGSNNNELKAEIEKLNAKLDIVIRALENAWLKNPKVKIKLEKKPEISEIADEVIDSEIAKDEKEAPAKKKKTASKK